MGNLVRAATADAVVVVRLRHGVVGETKRVCHVVPVPERGHIPAELTALCGEPILPAQAEVLDRVCGMPCETCLARSSRRNCHWLR